jgi:hypothetical protein
LLELLLPPLEPGLPVSLLLLPHAATVMASATSAGARRVVLIDPP